MVFLILFVFTLWRVFQTRFSTKKQIQIFAFYFLSDKVVFQVEYANSRYCLCVFFLIFVYSGEFSKPSPWQSKSSVQVKVAHPFNFMNTWEIMTYKSNRKQSRIKLLLQIVISGKYWYVYWYAYFLWNLFIPKSLLNLPPWRDHRLRNTTWCVTM